jgi:ankyrin repeat protein
VNARDYYLQTGRFNAPIHQAVWRENVELVRYLLSEPGIHLGEINVDGKTPWMIARQKGNSQILDMLLAAGASPTASQSTQAQAARIPE